MVPAKVNAMSRVWIPVSAPNVAPSATVSCDPERTPNPGTLIPSTRPSVPKNGEVPFSTRKSMPLPGTLNATSPGLPTSPTSSITSRSPITPPPWPSTVTVLRIPFAPPTVFPTVTTSSPPPALTFTSAPLAVDSTVKTSMPLPSDTVNDSTPS